MCAEPGGIFNPLSPHQAQKVLSGFDASEKARSNQNQRGRHSTPYPLL